MVFIQDFITKKSLTECNANAILMKTSFSIKMIEFNNYKKVELQLYQYFIGKLIYFTYGTRPNIAFVIGQLSKYNSDLRKRHL